MSDRRVLRAAVCAAALLSARFAQASQVELVSKRHPSFDSAEVVGQGEQAALSADGRWIAFTSTSPTWRRDRATATGFRTSSSSTGSPGTSPW